MLHYKFDRGVHRHEAGEEVATAALIDRLFYYDVTQDVAKQAGSLRYQWRRQGYTLSLADATIAAVALHHNLALLTDNRKHFPMPELALPPMESLPS